MGGWGLNGWMWNVAPLILSIPTFFRIYAIQINLNTNDVRVLFSSELVCSRNICWRRYFGSQFCAASNKIWYRWQQCMRCAMHATRMMKWMNTVDIFYVLWHFLSKWIMWIQISLSGMQQNCFQYMRETRCNSENKTEFSIPDRTTPQGTIR